MRSVQTWREFRCQAPTSLEWNRSYCKCNDAVAGAVVLTAGATPIGLHTWQGQSDSLLQQLNRVSSTSE